MTTPRAHRRRGIPDRWLLPPAPRAAVTRAHWRDMPFEQRRRLAATPPDEVAGRTSTERAVLADLAHTRVATIWRLFAAALVLGWLVLMTVWGFGRSSAAPQADAYRLAGWALGTLSWVLASLAAWARRRRARRVFAAVAELTPGDAAATHDRPGG